jgi:hypothetical protein
LSFRTNIRTGNGSLHVSIGGVGNLTSTQYLGGSALMSIGGAFFWNKPFFSGTAVVLANWCWRLA